MNQIDPSALFREWQALLVGRWLTDFANTASFFYHALPRLNWVGFYLFTHGRLELGPFHGKPACTEIPLSRGVCGHAAALQQTVIVPDVDAFPGHIACDSASRSELVVPIITASGDLFGVLDVDSDQMNRFTEFDQNLFEKVVAELVRRSLNALTASPHDRAANALDPASAEKPSSPLPKI